MFKEKFSAEKRPGHAARLARVLATVVFGVHVLGRVALACEFGGPAKQYLDEAIDAKQPLMFSECSLTDGGKVVLLLPVYTGLPLPTVLNPNISGMLLAIPPLNRPERSAVGAPQQCVPNPASVGFSIEKGVLEVTVEAENPGHYNDAIFRAEYEELSNANFRLMNPPSINAVLYSTPARACKVDAMKVIHDEDRKAEQESSRRH